MDTSIFNAINHFAQNTSPLHGVMLVWAVWLGVVVLAGLTVVSYIRARFLDDAAERVARLFWIPVGCLIALGLGQIVNHLVARPRPWQSLPQDTILVGKAYDYSFPSDHAIVIGGIVLGLYLAKDSLISFIALILGLTVGFARIYVGAHYPTDILGGMLIGGFVVGALSPLAIKLTLPLSKYMATTKFRPLVTSRPVPQETASRFAVKD